MYDVSGINTKAVIKYAVMPEILPRLERLFASGFGPVAYLMACIYNMVRLLPSGHPYLNPRNIGKFGIRHVIAEAANNLVVSRKNIDQIAIFVLLMITIVMLGLMLLTLAFNLIFTYAYAQAVGGVSLNPSMFVTSEPTNDIAFMLLDQVFGVGPQGTNSFFGSCVSQNIACFDGQTAPTGSYPWPFHLALQEVFKFYSSGILVVGALIFLYYLVVVVVETATSGSPFGQRFKNMWVPIRLVVAVGLLIPLNYGYNTAQYITFFAARAGSSFATNAWILYNNTVATEDSDAANPTGEKNNLVAFPGTADAATLIQMMSLIHSCAFSNFIEDASITNSKSLPSDRATFDDYMQTNKVKAWLVKTPQPGVGDQDAVRELVYGTNVPYETALNFYNRGDIVIRFGAVKDQPGGTANAYDAGEEIMPTCGDVRIVVSDHRLSTDAGATYQGDYLGAVEVQKYFYDLIWSMWFTYNGSTGAVHTGGVTGGGGGSNYLSSSKYLIDFAGRAYLLERNGSNCDPDEAGLIAKYCPCNIGCGDPRLPACNANSTPGVGGTLATPLPNSAPYEACTKQKVGLAWKEYYINDLQSKIDGQIEEIWNEYNQQSRELLISDDVLKYGWGGAGMWYNNLAQINGVFSSAVINYPSLDKYPAVMEDVAKAKAQATTDPSPLGLYNPNFGNDQNNEAQIEFAGGQVEGASKINSMYAVLQYFNTDGASAKSTEKMLTAGALENAINLVFGTNGLFDMTAKNKDIHPLAQLVSLGKGLVESSIRNLAGSTLIAAMGGLASAMETGLGPIMGTVSKFASSTAYIGLTAGFILYYVLPFLPFVYFYFAVATWVKSIFEAMVGVPLWALAHLRMDGEGLPGDGAANGYFLIFDIFIRPILSVVGLIAALLIFTAQVRILQFIWMLVTENVGGAPDSDAAKATVAVVQGLNVNRAIIDEFFYTVLYAIIVYMMATASFKLIDRIPDNLLRWMGQGVSSFSDINTDATEGLTRYAAVGGMQVTQQVSQGMTKLGGSLGNSIKGLAT